MDVTVWHCLFWNHPTSVPTHWSECVHASVHIFMPTWLLNSVPSPMHSDMERWVSVCGTVCIAVISFLFPHLVYNVYLHQYMYICQPEFWILLQPLCIVTWKHRWHCVALYLCSSHSTSGNTPWFECVHAWVHVFMSIWLLVSPQTPMHSYTETRTCIHVPLCGSGSFCPIHLISVPSFCMECVPISVHVFMPTWVLNSAPSPMHSDMETWMLLCGIMCFAVIPLLFPDLGQNVYMHQYIYYSVPDLPCLLHSISIIIWKDGFFCVALCACSSHSTSGPTTWLQYVHASVHEFMSILLSMCAPTPSKMFMETWEPLCGIVNLSPSLFFITHLG